MTSAAHIFDPSAIIAEQRRVEEVNQSLKDHLILTEGMMDNMVHFALDIGGLFPGAGEIADIANALLYAVKKEYFMAALSAISVVPVAGDAIGKGGKLALLMKKTGKGGKAVMKAIKWLQKMLKRFLPKIKKTFKKLKSNEKIGPHIDSMNQSIDDFLRGDAADKGTQQKLVQAATFEGPMDAGEVKKGMTQAKGKGGGHDTRDSEKKAKQTLAKYSDAEEEEDMKEGKVSVSELQQIISQEIGKKLREGMMGRLATTAAKKIGRAAFDAGTEKAAEKAAEMGAKVVDKGAKKLSKKMNLEGGHYMRNAMHPETGRDSGPIIDNMDLEGTPASRLGKDMLQKLDQLKSSTEDPEGGPPWIGADEIGEFIADQGGEKEALAYIEAMRQEIIDLMGDEQEEIEFSKRWNAGEEMGEEEMEDEEEL